MRQILTIKLLLVPFLWRTLINKYKGKSYNGLCVNESKKMEENTYNRYSYLEFNQLFWQWEQKQREKNVPNNIGKIILTKNSVENNKSGPSLCLWMFKVKRTI